ncbi:hypothetical protein [Candidatus Liberibacter sp.]|uniref:hypothetical protein n=1 Tax=Candidatus Liberibacter sp. TaxID=34022 RepID=UPI0015F442D0|nr:hypothetical protein [Candidatus Liberibacter sp.]MBA5723538.1 hypothetical protein [Candidatus Liberibacter sp.]
MNAENYKENFQEKSSELVAGELVSIPVIAEGAVKAYFFIKLSFNINQPTTKLSHHYIRDIASDYLYTLLVGSAMSDLSQIKESDLENFRKKVKEGLNSKLGVKILSDVFINQINYLSATDLHSSCHVLGNSIIDLKKRLINDKDQK